MFRYIVLLTWLLFFENQQSMGIQWISFHCMKKAPSKLSSLKQELLLIVLFDILHVYASSADLPWVLLHVLVSWQVGASDSSF